MDSLSGIVSTPDGGKSVSREFPVKRSINDRLASLIARFLEFISSLFSFRKDDSSVKPVKALDAIKLQLLTIRDKTQWEKIEFPEDVLNAYYLDETKTKLNRDAILGQFLKDWLRQEGNSSGEDIFYELNGVPLKQDFEIGSVRERSSLGLYTYMSVFESILKDTVEHETKLLLFSGLNHLFEKLVEYANGDEEQAFKYLAYFQQGLLASERAAKLHMDICLIANQHEVENVSNHAPLRVNVQLAREGEFRLTVTGQKTYQFPVGSQEIHCASFQSCQVDFVKKEAHESIYRTPIEVK